MASFFYYLVKKMIEKELIKDITEKYLEGTTMFLVDVVVKPGNAIVVEVDSDEGVSIDDCIALSRNIESHWTGMRKILSSK
jgi:Uncharacterised BCR, YhbC family COG0779.